MDTKFEIDRREALRRWMDTRDGVVTAAKLVGLGFTKREIDGMVVRGELIRVRRGVYRGRGARWDLRAQLRAALSEHGDEARLVLVSGLHWQGLLFWPAALPQVAVPGERGVLHLTGRSLYRTPFARADPVVHQGLACAAPFEALAHFAVHIRGDHAARRAFRRGLRESVRRDAGLIQRLRSHVDSAPSRGAGEVRAALRTLPSAVVVNSDMEEDFIRFCEIWGLPPFLMNHVVDGLERDAVRPDEEVIVELDTRGYHANLISFESDRLRRRQATVAGWRHLEITGVDLRDEPQRVARDLAIVLELSLWSPPPDAARRWAAVIKSARGVWLPRS